MTLLWRTRQLRSKAIAHKVKSRTHLYSPITFAEDTVICFNPGIHNLSQNSALGLIHLISGQVCGSQGIVHFPVLPSNHIFIFIHGLDNCLPLPLYVVYKQTEAKLLALNYTFHSKCLTSFVPEINWPMVPVATGLRLCDVRSMGHDFSTKLVDRYVFE